jgi:hypothetical protein
MGLAVGLVFLIAPCLEAADFELPPSWRAQKKGQSLDGKGHVDILSILRADPFDPKRGEGRIIDSPEGITAQEGVEKKYVLYGLVSAGGLKEAYLGLRDRKKGEGKEYRRVVEGDLVDGWKVVSIGERGIKLTSKGKEVFLRVFDQERPGRAVKRPVALATPRKRVQPGRAGRSPLTSARGKGQELKQRIGSINNRKSSRLKGTNGKAPSIRRHGRTNAIGSATAVKTPGPFRRDMGRQHGSGFPPGFVSGSRPPAQEPPPIPEPFSNRNLGRDSGGL